MDNTRKKPVVITYTRDTNEELQKYFKVVRLADVRDNFALRAEVEGLLCICTEIPPSQLISFLATLPALKLMMTTGIGVDFMTHTFDYCRSHGIVVTRNLGHEGAAAVLADFTMAMLLSAARMVTYGHMQSREGVEKIDEVRFRALSLSRPVTAATLGIVGMGNVGLHVARRAHHGFNMNILYHNRTQKNARTEQSISATFCPRLHDMLPQCDYVIIACSLNPHTHNMFSRTELQMMKDTAVLVNMARGEIVDTSALVTALESGEIGGAALDTTEPEPLPAGHPLLAMDNVIVTPHMAFTEKQYFDDMHASITRNFVSVLLEKRLPEDAAVVVEPDNFGAQKACTKHL